MQHISSISAKIYARQPTFSPLTMPKVSFSGKDSAQDWPKVPLYKRLYGTLRIPLALICFFLPNLYTPKSVEKATKASISSNLDNTNFLLTPKAIYSLSLLFTASLIAISGGILDLKSLKQRSALHEVGHFIAALDAKCVDKVTQVRSHWFTSGEVCPQYNSTVYSKEGFVELLKLLQAGKACERLHYGRTLHLLGVQDSVSPFLLALFDSTFQKPVKSLLKNWMGLDHKTQQLIQQVPFTTVQKMAQQLMKDEVWDETRIQEIIKEHRLDEIFPHRKTSTVA